MCNINAWFPIKPIKNKHLTQYWSYALHSAANNSDGFGLWLEKNSYRWPTERIPSILAMDKTLKRQPYIVTHQRLSTSGKTKKMIHPYIFKTQTKEDDIVLTGIHNGVLSFPFKYDDKLKSDSYIFFELLNATYHDADIHSFDDLNTHTLKALTALLDTTTGSASILFSLKFREKERFYYFKRSREIHGYLLDGGIYLSTTSRQALQKTEFAIKSEILYEINHKKAEMEELGPLVIPKPKKKKQTLKSLEKFSALALARVKKDYNISDIDYKELKLITGILLAESSIWEADKFPTTMPWRYVEDWVEGMEQLILEDSLKKPATLPSLHYRWDEVDEALWAEQKRLDASRTSFPVPSYLDWR